MSNVDFIMYCLCIAMLFFNDIVITGLVLCLDSVKDIRLQPEFIVLVDKFIFYAKISISKK